MNKNILGTPRRSQQQSMPHSPSVSGTQGLQGMPPPPPVQGAYGQRMPAPPVPPQGWQNHNFSSQQSLQTSNVHGHPFQPSIPGEGVQSMQDIPPPPPPVQAAYEQRMLAQPAPSQGLQNHGFHLQQPLSGSHVQGHPFQPRIPGEGVQGMSSQPPFPGARVHGMHFSFVY